MRRSLSALGLALAVFAFQSGVAHAANVTVTAAIVAADIGTRTMTPPAAIALSTSTGLDTVTGSMSTSVSELAKGGTNPWSVTVALSQLTRSGGTETLAAANVAVSGRSTSQLAGGGSVSSPAGSEAFDATRTLFTNNGQALTNVYTGSYSNSASLTLSVPNNTVAGSYIGTMTFTLVQ